MKANEIYEREFFFTTDSISHGSGRSYALLNASTQTYLRYWQLEQFLLDQERQKVDSNFEIACLKIGGGGFKKRKGRHARANLDKAVSTNG